MRIIKKALIVLLFLVFAGLMLPGIIQPPADIASAQKAQVKGLADVLIAALVEYEEKFGRFPEGEPAEIMQALVAESEPGKAIFIPAPDSLNDAGELVDPWGTPFRISFDLEKKLPRIHSAGPNRKFEDRGVMFLQSDDFFSWQ